jgi:hypothetical protein
MLAAGIMTPRCERDSFRMTLRTVIDVLASALAGGSEKKKRKEKPAETR